MIESFDSVVWVLFGLTFVNGLATLALAVFVSYNTRLLVRGCARIERFLRKRFTVNVDKI